MPTFSLQRCLNFFAIIAFLIVAGCEVHERERNVALSRDAFNDLNSDTLTKATLSPKVEATDIADSTTDVTSEDYTYQLYAHLGDEFLKVKQVKDRHSDKLFSIEGVHGVGITKDDNSNYIIRVRIHDEAARPLIPGLLEDVPVIVEFGEQPRISSGTNK